jgi:hypothetical protein
VITTMKIRELFAKDVTRPIAPVVYFQDDDPAKLHAEVREYIVTGGYPPNDPRARRSEEGGIHEELVRLLRNLRAEIDRGTNLPACWISGYYGSGKSSFAKLLGLSLDGRKLDDGTPLVDAFLGRDESPLRSELVQAWSGLVTGLRPMAVIFDIGSKAHTGEHVHSAIVRQTQQRLGYCRRPQVADFELALEIDGHYPAFLEAAKKALKRPWSELKDTQLAVSHFSHAMHAHDPERYREPTSWLDSQVLAESADGTDSSSAVNNLSEMIRLRAPGRTLFLVVDEVSQYVHDSGDRMLKLQSFVSELGARLKGGVWLLATGQQKLDDAAGTALAKLKDRFPPRLRVHLGTANIRDVVHQRLLKKAQAGASLLAQEFERHRADLRLYAYGCQDVTDEDFVDVYPMLPKQIDLLLKITTAIRARSTRTQGDAQEIRGLLQLLAALFTERGLAEREVGELVTLDTIYDVLHTGLDNDTQMSMSRILDDCTRAGDVLGVRVAKAVARLELGQRDDIQTEEARTSPQLVARCLYDRLGRGDLEPPVTASLERLRTVGLLGYSEKTGYKLQSSAGQEWQRERDGLRVPAEQVTNAIQEALEGLTRGLEKPKLGNLGLPWLAFFSDGRHANDVRVSRPSQDAVVTVDFRWVGPDQQGAETWLKATHPETGNLPERLVWVVGSPGRAVEIAQRLGRSQHMVERYQPRRESLTDARKSLLRDEEGQVSDLLGELKQTVQEAFLGGSFYFAGRAYPARQEGSSFTVALHDFAEKRLKELYPHYIDLTIEPAEIQQLLQPQLHGPSPKFFEKQLGLLTMDAGKIIPTCDGLVPRRMLELLKRDAGLAGSALLAALGKPPCGYSDGVVHATALGLLRAGKIHIELDGGGRVTDVRDPGAQNLFTRDRDFRRAAFYVALDEALTQKDRNAICRVLEMYLRVELDRENGPIADVVHERFGAQRERLRQIERRFVRLPGQRAFQPKLERFGQALEHCRRSREVEPTVKAVKTNIDVLRDGFEALGRFETDLNDAVIDALVAAATTVNEQVAQLESVGAAADIAADAKTLREHLAAERPWIEAHSLAGPVERILERYRVERTAILGRHELRANAAREALKRRVGFERLGPDAAHHVLRPISEALWDTSADAVAPRLDQLRDGFPKRLEVAEETANARLDDALETLDARPVVQIALSLRNREVETLADLDALLKEIDGRIREPLEQKKRVRIV